MGTAHVTERADGSITIRFPFNRWVIDQIKTYIPSYDRAYDAGNKAWTISGFYARDALSFLRQAFDHVEVIRSQKQADPEPRINQSHRGPYADLHLLPSAPPELVAAAYRCLAKLCHPDRGGSVTDMQRINAAMSLIQNTKV